MEIVRADLFNASVAEVFKHLLDEGITSQVYKDYDGLHIVTDVDATAAMASFVPSDEEPWQDYLPADYRLHLGHLRDYRTAIRNGQAVTNAQTTHVIADIIDALKILNARITGD